MPIWVNTGASILSDISYQVLEGINFAFGYLDDILIFSPNMEQHLVHVRVLFERLSARPKTDKAQV